jgi:type I restriction enzyme M protein
LRGQRSVDQTTLQRSDLDDFVNCYFGCSGVPVERKGSGSQSRLYNGNRHKRKASERFKSFTYEELIKRDKINLDILIPSLPFAQSASRPSRLIRRTRAAQLWLEDEALEDSANLPAPEVIAADIDS